MHEVMIRFRLVQSGRIIECLMDDRLDLKENLAILSDLTGEDISGSLVYDPIKKIFLDRNIPLSSFNMDYFMMLYLFS